MNIVVMVTEAPSSRLAWYALELVTALAAEHRVQVFFYGDAVQVANRNFWVSADQLNLHQRWQQLDAEKWVCATAALASGVVDAENARQYHLPDAVMHSSFRTGGLGEFALMAAQADRVLQF